MKKNSTQIYKIGFSEDFFESLTQGIITKMTKSCKLNHVTLLLPTANSCITYKNYCNKNNIEIGKIYSISDLTPLNPGTVKPLSRLALLDKITFTLEKIGIKNTYQLIELSEYIYELLNKLDYNMIDYVNFVDHLLENDIFSKQILVKILQDFFNNWDKNNHLTTAYCNNIIANNLQYKDLIIAGANSSYPYIIEIIKKANQFTNSFVILYGLDDNITEEEWKNISKNHPQYNIKKILQDTDLRKENIDPWNVEGKSHSILTKVFLPYIYSDQWYKISNKEGTHLHFYRFADQYCESSFIIETLKKEVDQEILIVTTDENLTINLISFFNSNEIKANIIRDHPLRNSQAGIWIQLCLNFIYQNNSSEALLALLKHPFSRFDNEIIGYIEKTLRENNFHYNLEELLYDSENLDKFYKNLNKFKSLSFRASFSTFFQHHIELCQSLGKADIWEEEDAQELQQYFNNIIDSYNSISTISYYEYPQIYSHFVKSAFYREKTPPIHKITLAKPVDARLHKAPLVILCGLNEGIWPSKPNHDICLTNNIIEKLNLKTPDQALGEEAHDFQSFLNAPKVILTYSDKIQGTEASPSPWILKLLTILKKEAIYIARQIDQSKKNDNNVFYPPNPPVVNRPHKISVTQIEKLIFNPYHFYVDQILKLKPLNSLEKILSPIDFGNFIHKAIEIYHQNKENNLQAAGEQALISLRLNQSKIKILWWPRFVRISQWYEIFFPHKEKGVFLENKGYYNIENVIITAKADRIEIDSNLVSIYDFKTGKLASQKSIKTGQTIQLLLEGIMALEKSFNAQKKNVNYIIEKLSYIQLSGSEEPAQILSINLEDGILNNTKAYITNLFKEYNNPNTPYYYTEKKIIGYCHYEHLARKF